MKHRLNIQIILVLCFSLFIFTINLKVIQAQTVYPVYYHVISLHKDSIPLDNINYYVKEVIDCREDTSKIGIIKDGLFDNKYPAKLDTNLNLALKRYFDELLPANEVKKPIIIRITRFNISEKADANTDNGKTIIAMEFFIEENSLFTKIFETEQSISYTYADVTKLHEKYIRKTLLKCVDEFSHSNKKLESKPINYQQLITKVSSKKNQNETNTFISKAYYSKLNITMGGGFGYLFGKIPQEMPKELKKYTNGIKYAQNFAFDFNFFLTKKIGIGFSYANYSSNDAIDNFKIYENDVIKYEGRIVNDITIKKYGPTINYRKLVESDNLMLNASIGLQRLQYIDDAVLFGKANKIEANTSCLLGKFGIDYYLFKNIALNFNLSALWGNIKKMEVNGLATDLEKKASLLRSDVNIGITFCY